MHFWKFDFRRLSCESRQDSHLPARVNLEADTPHPCHTSNLKLLRDALTSIYYSLYKHSVTVTMQNPNNPFNFLGDPPIRNETPPTPTPTRPYPADDHMGLGAGMTQLPSQGGRYVPPAMRKSPPHFIRADLF